MTSGVVDDAVMIGHLGMAAERWQGKGGVDVKKRKEFFDRVYIHGGGAADGKRAVEKATGRGILAGDQIEN